MKILLILLTVLAIVSCTAADNSNSSKVNPPDIEKNKDVTVAQLHQALEIDSTIYLLDVRTLSEYKSAHLAKTDIRFSYDSINYIADLLPSKKDTELFCYCRSGHRSGIVSDQLRKLGYSNVHNVIGGIIAWQKAGYEVVSGK